jgi:hypothetical protein
MRTIRAKVGSICSHRDGKLRGRLAWAIGGAGAALLMTACAFSLPAGQAAATGSASDPPGIVGMWLVTVTPVAPGVPFQSTIVYTRDGAVIEATSRPFMTPTADTSEGLGVWSGAGASVRMTFHKYLFDSQGHYIGRTVVVETETLNHQGSTYTGKAVATVLDVNGNVLTTIASSTSAQRMSVSA